MNTSTGATTVSLETPHDTQSPGAADLAPGLTCLDCLWFVRCSVVLGVAELGQQHCDWSPSRFQERNSGNPHGWTDESTQLPAEF